MPIEPNTKADLFNQGSAESANTDVFASDVTPSDEPLAFLITVQVASASTVILAETDSSNNTETEVLNDGATLDAGELYTFSVPVRESRSYNIQLGSGVTIDRLSIDEIDLRSVNW